MKIGILTHFHKSTNYGGVLQAYALCKYLNMHGHSAYQILYVHKAERIGETKLTIKEFFSKIYLRLNKKIHRKKNQHIKKRMESQFVKFRDNVPHTQREYIKSDIGDTANDFDAFVVGSDQVWNPIWYDSAYMLDFVSASTTKISYAASIGVNSFDVDQKNIFKKYLSSFQAISVREKSAISVLAPLVNIDVNVSVDPTMLLSVDDWNEIATDRIIKERYVFLYVLGDDIEIRKLAEGFAKHKGIKLVMIPDLLGNYRKKDRKIKSHMITDATPEDFISLIKYAEYVFTDSFHACVFSLLYRRDFFAFQRLGSIEIGSRIQNLMDMFECSERFCSEKEKINIQYLLSMHPMDYSKTFELFNREKQKSMNYLENYLVN